MKYLLMGSQLYVERDDGCKSIRYNASECKWVNANHELADSRVGYDPYEPEGSPYRYGCGSCMIEIKSITKEEAEQFINTTIDEDELLLLLDVKEE